MSEWLKEHAWKACVGETLPWVRIPLSPPILEASFSTAFPPEVFAESKGLRLFPLRGFDVVQPAHVADKSARGEAFGIDGSKLRLPHDFVG